MQNPALIILGPKNIIKTQKSTNSSIDLGKHLKDSRQLNPID